VFIDKQKPCLLGISSNVILNQNNQTLQTESSFFFCLSSAFFTVNVQFTISNNSLSDVGTYHDCCSVAKSMTKAKNVSNLRLQPPDRAGLENGLHRDCIIVIVFRNRPLQSSFIIVVV